MNKQKDGMSARGWLYVRTSYKLCVVCVLCVSVHSGGPGNTTFGGLANGSTLALTVWWRPGRVRVSFVVDLHTNNGAYNMHTVRTLQEMMDQIPAIIHGPPANLGVFTH